MFHLVDKLLNAQGAEEGIWKWKSLVSASNIRYNNATDSQKRRGGWVGTEQRSFDAKHR